MLLGKYGGTSQTEAGVENGLAWLAKQQRADGTWSLTGPYSDGSRTGENSVAATAMALLAFQGHGDTHRDGQYAKVVSADGPHCSRCSARMDSSAAPCTREMSCSTLMPKPRSAL